MTYVIAIDGPAAAGKGTLAKGMAQVLDFAYLDTGSLYRAVGVKAAEMGALADASGVAATLDIEDTLRADLRDQLAGSYASKVAVQPGVRAALLSFQHEFGRTPPGGKPGAILDGRDIGTVIFPGANLKLFVTASARVRAARRHRELDPDTRPNFDEVLAQVIERDERDQNRSEAPLKPALDAHLIDTSEMDASTALQLALSFVSQDR